MADCPKCADLFPGVEGIWLDDNVIVRGTRQSNNMVSATLPYAATAVAIDGPLLFGDAIAAVAIAGAVTYQYSPALIEKMNREIAGIQQRLAGPQGVQYSLRATQSGSYPCYTCPNGTTDLRAGEVWKYGETTNPSTRYSQNYLRMNRVQMVNEFYGNQMQIKLVEKLKIYGYFFNNGQLPAGNRIFR